MAVKTGVAKQALGFVEEKLRRVFNLAGPIDASLNPEVSPVIIVDDLRAPGHAFLQGRSWAWQVSSVGIVAGLKGADLRFLSDCLVEGFWIYHPPLAAATSDVMVYIVTPDQFSASPPIGGGLANFGAWRDRKLTATDVPPVGGNGSFVAITGTGPTGNNIVFHYDGIGTPQPGFVPMQLFMPAGSCMVFVETDQPIFSVGAMGRVWPQ